MKALSYLKDKGRFLIAFVVRRFSKSQNEVIFNSYILYNGRISLLKIGLFSTELNHVLFLQNYNKKVYVCGISVDYLKFEQIIEVKDC